MLRSMIVVFLLVVLSSGCAGSDALVSGAPADSTATVPAVGDPPGNCPVTEAVWAKPPEDAAVLTPPDYGDYFINADGSIWASAGWAEQADAALLLNERGVKVGWFRPEGAALEIRGQRMDAQAPPLEASVPCCYPTRFQASGLIFPTPGCWEVSGRAADRELTFVVWIAP